MCSITCHRRRDLEGISINPPNWVIRGDDKPFKSNTAEG
jgi:hypothetical protein